MAPPFRWQAVMVTGPLARRPDSGFAMVARAEDRGQTTTLTPEVELAGLRRRAAQAVSRVSESRLPRPELWDRPSLGSSGGTLYASGATSLVKNTGQRQQDFMLGGVLGVSLTKADWTDREHYVVPTTAGQQDFRGWDTKYPAFIRGPTMDVRAYAGSTVLATRTLPWPAPDARSFSSIHSNPPWQATDQPEVLYHRFGQGTALYCASLVEDVETLQESFVCLLRRLCPRPAFELSAHPAVEATLFHQPDRRRYVLSLVSFQHDLPNVPADGIEVRLRLPQRVQSASAIPSGRALRLRREGDRVVFIAPRLETLLILAVDHA